MKNYFLLFIFLFTASTFTVKSQAHYEKGYFIDSLGVRTECLIDNKDWEVSPTEISYKITEQSERIKINTSTIQEFEIFGSSKFISKVVLIDKSSSEISELSPVKNPVWKTQRLLIKELVSGKASLYKYSEYNLIRFFYAVNDSGIQQLVHKTYQATNENLEKFIGTNNNFRQQLFVDVNIPDYKYDLTKIMYEQKELTNYFEDYNAQFVTSKTVIKKEKSKKDFFKASILVGANYTNMKVVYAFISSNTVDFGAFISPTVGAEFEFTLPLGRNNWSILLQPVYNSKISGKLQSIRYSDFRPIESEFSYQGIDVPLGVRYRYSLSNKLKVYATGYVETGFISWYKTFISVDQKPFVILLARALTPGFSIGTDYNNIGLELKAFANRDFIVRQQTVRTDFNVVSLSIKYRLVDLKINR
jgi:hypothetical protein